MSDFNNELGQAQSDNIADSGEFHIPDNLFNSPEETPTETPTENVSEPEDTNKELISETSNKEDELFAKKFAALSRKEKLLREREEKLKQQAESSPFDKYEKLVKEDPLALLDKLGLSYEDLTQRLLDKKDLESDPEYKYSKLEKKIKEMETRREEEEKLKLQTEQQRIVDDFKSNLNDFVKSNSDTYEFIVANDAQELVFNTISDHYQETGKILSNEEAANAVEEYLEQKIEKLKNLKKFKTKILGEQLEQPTPEKNEVKVMGQTLSNSQSSVKTTTSPDELMSKEEALKFLNWDD